MKKLIKILLIEDNDVDAYIATHRLKSACEDCEIIHLKNGQQGLEYILNPENKKPDLIITDLNMPVMNGKELLERVSSNQNLQNVDIAVLTSSGNHQDIDDCMAFGAKGCFEKPLNTVVTQELMNIISE